MSAISLKSITGITSITTPAGVDNQLTLHANNTTERVKIDEAGNVRVANTFDCVGVSTFRNNLFAQADLRIAGEIVHISDDNTRIRFPSNDTISFETNGSERLSIDSDGHLLVSTTKLSSQNGSIQAAGPIIAKSYINSHTSNATVIEYNSNVSSIRAYGATSGSGILTFNTGGGGNSTDSEAVRIDSNGYLIAKADIRLRRTASDNGALYFGDTNNNYIFGSDADDVITFATAGNERIRINSDGHVDVIGHLDIGSGIDVTGNITGTGNVVVSSSGNQIFNLTATSFTVSQYAGGWSSYGPILAWDYKTGPGDLMYMASGGNTAAANQMALVISDTHGFKVGKSGYDGTDFDVSSSAEYLRVTESGNVGIGTNNPVDILDINSDSASAVTNMYLRNHANLGGAALNLYTQGTYASPTYRAIIGCSDAGGNIRMGAYSNHDLLLLTNNGPKVTIKSGGFVGINDTSPDKRLTVTTSNEDAILIKNTNNAQYASARIHLQGPGSADNVTALVHGQLQNAGGDSYFAIESKTSSHVYKKTLMLYDHNTNHWAFYAGPEDGSSPERFRLFSDGSAELGNTGTASEFDGLRRLDIINRHSDTDSGTLLRLITRDAGTANTTESFDIVKYRNGNVSMNNNCATAVLDMYAGGATRFRISQAGKINCSYENPGDAQYGNLEITKNGVSNVDTNWSYLSFHRVGRIGFQQGLIVDDLVFATTGGAARNDLQNERFRIKSNGAGVVIPQDARLESAPNSTWGAGLYMGGNGNASSSTHGSMVVTNGNLHLDSRDGGYGCYLQWYGGTDGTRFGNGAGGQNGHMQSNGNLSITGSYTSSDQRLKENIQNISGATDTIKSLVGKTFTWKKDTGLDDWKHYGFIAQEVQKVVPDLVKDNGNQYFDKDDKIVSSIEPTESDEDRKSAGLTKSLTVNNEGVTPILVEAMNELIAKVETLEAEVAALKSS